MLSFPICHPIFQTVCSDRVMGGECLFIRPQKGESHLVRLPQKLDSFNICVFKLETEKWELLNFAGKALASPATLCLVGAASKSNSSGTHLSIDPSANLLNLVKIFVQRSRKLFFNTVKKNVHLPTNISLNHSANLLNLAKIFVQLHQQSQVSLASCWQENSTFQKKVSLFAFSIWLK